MSEQAADPTAGDEKPDHVASGGEGDADELLDKLGFEDADPNGTSQGAESERVEPTVVVDQSAVTPSMSSSSRTWAVIAGVLAIGLVAAIGAVIWLATSDDSSEIATDDTVEVGTARAAVPELDVEADRLRDSLEGLGLDGVEVAVRGSIIYVEGTVSNEDEVAAVYGAAESVTDGILVDVSGLVSDASYGQETAGDAAEGGAAPAGGAPEPGAPPPPGAGPPPGQGPPGAPPFGPPPNEPRLDLQAELDRVLETTPLVFESGQTDLTDTQKAVLDSTVTSLIYTYPGIPIRVVGYTDEAGDDDANIQLSIKRANAVKEHLILQGVPGFGMITEGRGESNASGDPALDRRVELEVVLLEDQTGADG